MSIPLTAPIRTRAQQRLELRIGEPLAEALRRLYVDEGRNQDEIAAGWGIDRATVSRWMAQFGIETRLTGPRP